MTIKQLLARYGSQAEVARAFGVTRVSVHLWVKAGVIPAARLWQLQAGKVAPPRK